MNRIRIAAITAAIVLTGVGYSVFGRIDQSQESDPTGRYFAVISHRPYQCFLPIGGGTDSDSPCFVRVEDTSGTCYGEVPVPILQAAEVRWEPGIASIQNIGEWDLISKTCYYWSEDGNQKIFTKR